MASEAFFEPKNNTQVGSLSFSLGMATDMEIGVHWHLRFQVHPWCEEAAHESQSILCLQVKGWQHHLSQKIGPAIAGSARPTPPALSERNECVKETVPL